MNTVSNTDNVQACRREKLSLNDYQEQQRNVIDPVLAQTYGIHNEQIANLIASFLPVMPTRHTLADPSGRPVTHCAISADSQYLVAVCETASSPATLKLWNVATGTCQQTTSLPSIRHAGTRFPESRTCQLSISPDNQRLLTVHQIYNPPHRHYDNIRIWNTITLECLECYTLTGGTPLQCVFLSAEKVITLWRTSGESDIDIWDLPTDIKRTIVNREETITQFSITNHGQNIVYLKENHRVENRMLPYEIIICDMSTANVLYSLTSGRLSMGSQAKLSATADRVVLRLFNCPLNETTVESWNPATGQSLAKHTYDPRYAGSILNTWTPVQLTVDGERILIFGRGWTEGAVYCVRLEELRNGRELQCFPAASMNGDRVINCFAMPPTEQFVVTGNTMGELHIWDPATGRLIGEKTNESESISKESPE